MSTEQANAFSALPGTRYQARKKDDGTWDVLDVPIFATVPKGVKGAPKDIGADELREAVAVHRRKHDEDGFLARTNAGHNDGFHKPTPAGFFLPKDVREIRFGGRRQPVLFADLLSVPDEVIHRIEAQDLPYRSVEIRDWEPLSFGALALLDTEPPFFELPMMVQLDKDEAASFHVDVMRFRDPEQEPAVASFVSSTSSRFLFRFEDEGMPDEEKKEKDEAQMQEGEGPDVGAIVKMIESGEIPVKDLDAIVEAIEKQRSAATESEEPAEEPAATPVEMSAEKKAAMSRADVEQEARIASLEDFRANVQARDAQQAAFDSAVKTLEGEGYHVADSTREKLFKVAGQGKEMLSLFVDTYRETVPKEPPDDIEAGGAAGESLPEEVMAFSNKGPEAFSAAKVAYREYLELPDDRYRSPLGKFLERDLQQKGVI